MLPTWAAVGLLREDPAACVCLQHVADFYFDVEIQIRNIMQALCFVYNKYIYIYIDVCIYIYIYIYTHI